MADELLRKVDQTIGIVEGCRKAKAQFREILAGLTVLRQAIAGYSKTCGLSDNLLHIDAGLVDTAALRLVEVMGVLRESASSLGTSNPFVTRAAKKRLPLVALEVKTASDVLMDVMNKRSLAITEYVGRLDDAQVLYESGMIHLERNDTWKAFELFLASANKGHAAANVRVGVCYASGCGTRKNADAAREYLKKGVAEGDAEATHWLGVVTEEEYNEGVARGRDAHGRGDGGRHSSKRKSSSRRAVRSRSPDKAAGIGSVGLGSAAGASGEIGDSDIDGGFNATLTSNLTGLDKARVLYERAGAAGWGASLVRLGELAEAKLIDISNAGAGNAGGLTTTASAAAAETNTAGSSHILAAASYYRRAQSAGSVKGANLLGALIVRHHREEPALSHEECVESFEFAAQRGDASAMNNLGVVYEEGVLVERDIPSAHEWYAKALQRGFVHAAGNLGYLALLDRDYALAADMLKRAVGSGVASARFYLGTMYEQGDGVAKDAARAASLYHEAATDGDGCSRSENRLGCLYYSGHGVGKDRAAALRWFTLSADKGNPEGLNNLACMYERGDDEACSADPMRALALYKRAAGLGHADAAYNVGLMYRDGVGGVGQDRHCALKWLCMATEFGHIAASATAALIRDEQHGRDEADEVAKAESAWYRESHRKTSVGVVGVGGIVVDGVGGGDDIGEGIVGVMMAGGFVGEVEKEEEEEEEGSDQHPHVKEGTNTPMKEGTNTPMKEGTNTPMKEGTNTPMKKGTNTPMKEGTNTPMKEGTNTPMKEGTNTPMKKGTNTPMKEGTNTPMKEGTNTPM